MARIIDTFTWLTHRDDLKAYLRISLDDISQDDRLELWFDTAVFQGELFVDKNFVDSASASIPPPSMAKVGIYEYVKVMQQRLFSLVGAKAVKTGALAMTFAHDGNTSKMALVAAMPFWRPIKRDLLAA